MSGVQRLDADVCVIGAGAGGAVVAAELAEGGARVVVLEQGSHHDPDAFTAKPMEMMARLYRDGGQTTTLGNPPILLPLGRGLGGTTLVNSGTCFRTPPHVLERWRNEHGLELEGASSTRASSASNGLSRSPRSTPSWPGPTPPSRAAGPSGWAGRTATCAATPAAASAPGCAPSAAPPPPSSTPASPTCRAPRRLGATVLTGADVRRVRWKAGVRGGPRAKGRGVARAVGDGRRQVALEVRAPRVVVAAGTIHTPLLLARSGVGADSGALGRNLVLHPATAAFGVMDEVVDMARGVPQSFYVDEFASEGIMFEGVAGPPAYVALSLPLTGARHAAAMADYRHLAQFGLMVSDSSHGSVRAVGGRFGGQALIRYDLVEADVAKFRDGPRSAR